MKPMCKQIGCFVRGGFVLVTPYQGLDWSIANKECYCLHHVRLLYWDRVKKEHDDSVKSLYRVYKVEEWPVSKTRRSESAWMNHNDQ